MDSLDEAGIADNMIVVYTSDNGRGPGRTPDQPMQGRELTTWEGGLSVSATVSGPGIRKGTTSSDVVSALDWYPTRAPLTGNIHSSHGELVAVRSGKWKLFLNSTLILYDLEADPGESKPVRQAEILRKLCGIAVLFQEEMSRNARKAGEWIGGD